MSVAVQTHRRILKSDSFEVEKGFIIFGKDIWLPNVVVDVLGRDKNGRLCVVEVKTTQPSQRGRATIKRRNILAGMRQLVMGGRAVNQILSWVGAAPVRFRYILYLWMEYGPTVDIRSWDTEDELLREIKATSRPRPKP